MVNNLSLYAHQHGYIVIDDISTMSFFVQNMCINNSLILIVIFDNLR